MATTAALNHCAGAPRRRHGSDLHRLAADAGDDRFRRVQEDVDVIGLSILSAHTTRFARSS